MSSSEGSLLVGYGTAEARWARLGPYYATFPVGFAEQVIHGFSREGDVVLDPFCGRGTAPYVAMISGRAGYGCEINPVGWVYAATKCDPHRSLQDVEERIVAIGRRVKPGDRQPENEFQELAFAPAVLGFINAARRTLRWRTDSCDRTVAGLLCHSLHAKLGEGLSNQMRPTRAMAPNYSISWWKEQGLTAPPDIDPARFLTERAAWRYAKGTPGGQAWVGFGDSATALSGLRATVDLVVTSPPYVGVTNYNADNWLRLWALGEGPPLADWSAQQRHCDTEKYETMLGQVIGATVEHAHKGTVWWFRVDARPATLQIVERVLERLLPGHNLARRHSPAPDRTQTALYGDHSPKPGDVDLVALPATFNGEAQLETLNLEMVA